MGDRAAHRRRLYGHTAVCYGYGHRTVKVWCTKNGRQGAARGREVEEREGLSAAAIEARNAAKLRAKRVRR